VAIPFWQNPRQATHPKSELSNTRENSDSGDYFAMLPPFSRLKGWI
jgi:hypothetical protein